MNHSTRYREWLAIVSLALASIAVWLGLAQLLLRTSDARSATGRPPPAQVNETLPGVAAPTQPDPGPPAEADAALPGGRTAPDYPYISHVDARTRDIFLRGLALGGRAGVFSKVGDSITQSGGFLQAIGLGEYNLGEYAWLEPAIGYYSAEIARDQNSFANTSLAAQTGWLAGSVLHPAKADRQFCREAESPLACEYRLVRPTAAVIMLGTNDAPGTPPEAFEFHLRRIVATSVEMGIVPILSTLPPLHRDGMDGRVERLNGIIAGIAQEHSLPLIDYWAALQGLPNDGLGPDGIHPSWPPGHAADFTPEYLRYGMTVRNLLTLQSLEAVWRVTVQ